MDIPGYSDDLEELQPGTTLVDASELLGDERFRPAFLLNVAAAEAALRAFDVDPADLEPFLDVLEERLKWPVISIGLADGHRLHIVCRNLDGDVGIDYVLQPADGSQVMVLAAIEGGFRGPALAWRELIAASGQPDPVLSAEELLLLLLPSCADLARPRTAQARVVNALAAVGARGDLGALAVQLLECKHFWAPCSWAVLEGALVSGGAYATRQLNGALPADSLRLITQAFRPRPPH